MARKSREDRRAALRKRTAASSQNREKTGGGGATSVLNHTAFKEVAQRANREIKLFRPTDERRMLLDLLPYEITQDWYSKLRTPFGRTTGLEPGDIDYKLETPVHKGVGPGRDTVLCLREAFGKHCEICEEMFTEYKKDAPDKDKTNALRPSWRCYYNVYDYDNPDADIQLWEDMSFHSFEKWMLKALETGDGEYVVIGDPEEGRSVDVKFNEKVLGKNKFLEAGDVELKEREPYPEGIVDETYPLDKGLIIPTVDEVTRLHLGIDEADEKSAGGEEERRSPKDQPTGRRSRPGRGGTPTQEKTDGCPSGGVFGRDCNELSNCQRCPEELFQACADAQDKMGADGSPDEQTPTPEPAGESTAPPPAAARRARRERPAEVANSESPERRRRR